MQQSLKSVSKVKGDGVILISVDFFIVLLTILILKTISTQVCVLVSVWLWELKGN